MRSFNGQVFNLLPGMRDRQNVGLPDSKVIFLYLCLFTIVILTPEKFDGHKVATSYPPDLSILHNGHSNTLTTAKDVGVAWIFDVLAVAYKL